MALTHQRLGVLFRGWLELSDTGGRLLLDGVSPLGGLTSLWLRCGGDGQEHGWGWQSEKIHKKGQIEKLKGRFRISEVSSS